MIFISILILIVAIALPSFNKKISPILFTRISSIIFMYAGALSFNALYIQSIGSGIGIYSGLFHVTYISQMLEVFLFLIGSVILIAWPLNYTSVPSGPWSPSSYSTASAPLLLGQGLSYGRDKVEPQVDTEGQETAFLSQGEPKVWTGEGAPDIRLESKGSNVTIHAFTIKSATEYSLIVLFSTLGSSLLVSSADLISMYLSIELQSFGVYILATLYRDSESATSAGLKYFLLGGLSSCIILLGAGFIYTFTGLTNFDSIYSLISVYPSSLTASGSEVLTPIFGMEGILNSLSIIQGFSLGIILIIVGFLFKIAAAPLHNWAPDVYNDSPTIVTLWLTIMPKISILILLLELQTHIGFINEFSTTSLMLSDSSLMASSTSASPVGGEDRSVDTLYLVTNLLLISSLVSLVIGTVVGLAQTKIKRLLAYSTISHIGFILLALAINSEQSIDSLIFYIIQYSITNLNTFLIIIALGYIMHKSNINVITTTATEETSGRKGMTMSTLSTVASSPALPITAGSEAELVKEVVQEPSYSDASRLEKENASSTDITFISELKGQFFSNPLLSLSITICLFSMAGIPPLIGFFSKQFVLYSAVEKGYYFIAIIAILVSVISASYYLKIIRVLYSESDHSSSIMSVNTSLGSFLSSADIESKEPSSHPSASTSPFATPHITSFHSFLISSLTLSIVLFVLKPSIILNSTQLLSLSLYNY